jgi:hypothetical protein
MHACPSLSRRCLIGSVRMLPVPRLQAWTFLVENGEPGRQVQRN